MLRFLSFYVALFSASIVIVQSASQSILAVFIQSIYIFLKTRKFLDSVILT